ncbi:MAG TPA: hypothetical protein PKH97_10860 [Tetrasphaera sp.]|uniref:hypothetical protein n=1 Tax=Nostocoides sp. TaxID=1917966 RepID=UPI002CF0B90B|nr:hypothetical protein [Tetrasphaera sp.]HNQ07674.1 hypothetical protein [Tetrasphaera sp.]
MTPHVALLKRLAGALLVLIGLVPLAFGTYAAARLGTSGSATFVVKGVGTSPVLLTPDVLNRTDLPVEIALTPRSGASALVVIGTPSDTQAALGTAGHTRVTGVDVRAGQATTADTAGRTVEPLGELTLWRKTEQVTAPATVTITQATAPESVLIAPAGAGLASMALTWANPTWFYQALVLAGSGGLLMTVGWLLVRPAPKAKELAR